MGVGSTVAGSFVLGSFVLGSSFVGAGEQADEAMSNAMEQQRNPRDMRMANLGAEPIDYQHVGVTRRTFGAESSASSFKVRVWLCACGLHRSQESNKPKR